MPTPPTEVNFFVYGTLKRGECRQHSWPRSPSVVEQAWVLGELYDAGSYPALLAGTDKVLGELWSFAPTDFDAKPMVLEIAIFTSATLTTQRQWHTANNPHA